jgi:hypothetical protein
VPVAYSHLGDDLTKSCGLSKSRGEDDAETIMAWHGYTRTGGMIDIGGGVQAPEYALTSPEQQAIGRADPYGYRTRSSSAGVTWTTTKQLYR